MRMPIFAVVLAPLLSLACDRAPVAPDVPDVAPPLLSATHGEFVAEGTDNFTDFVSCANDGLGEWMHWTGSWRIRIRTVTSDSGNELWRYVDNEYLDGYQMKGTTSGEVWTILPGDSRVIGQNHYEHNGNWGRNTVFLERYENQDGDIMFVQAILHLTFANGEWRGFRIATNACSLH